MRILTLFAVISGMLFTSHTALADTNGAVGAVLGAGIGGYAGSKATKDGKPVKNGTAYGVAVGAVLGSLLAPSTKQPDTIVNVTIPDQTPEGVQKAPAQATQVVYQQVPSQPQVVYVVTGPQAETYTQLRQAEEAYWRGYSDAQRSRPYRYGCEYGGFRYNPAYCR